MDEREEEELKARVGAMEEAVEVLRAENAALRESRISEEQERRIVSLQEQVYLLNGEKQALSRQLEQSEADERRAEPYDGFSGW